MDFLYLCGNGFGISMDRIIDQLGTLPDTADRFIVPDLPDSPEKFQPDFFIRDACCLGFFIIRKIAQMDQQRQYIIPVADVIRSLENPLVSTLTSTPPRSRAIVPDRPSNGFRYIPMLSTPHVKSISSCGDGSKRIWETKYYETADFP